MTWTLYYTKQAQKDAKKLASSGLKVKAPALLAILEKDPWQNLVQRKSNNTSALCPPTVHGWEGHKVGNTIHFFVTPKRPC